MFQRCTRKQVSKKRVKYVNFAKTVVSHTKTHTEFKFRVLSHQNRCTHVSKTNKAKSDSLAMHTSGETMLNERIRVLNHQNLNNPQRENIYIIVSFFKVVHKLDKIHNEALCWLKSLLHVKNYLFNAVVSSWSRFYRT